MVPGSPSGLVSIPEGPPRVNCHDKTVILDQSRPFVVEHGPDEPLDPVDQTIHCRRPLESSCDFGGQKQEPDPVLVFLVLPTAPQYDAKDGRLREGEHDVFVFCESTFSCLPMRTTSPAGMVAADPVVGAARPVTPAEPVGGRQVSFSVTGLVLTS